MNRKIETLNQKWIEENIDLNRSDSVALFDVDSTIMDTAPRNHAILKEAEKEFPFLEGVSQKLTVEMMGWSICDDVHNIRKLEDKERKALFQFWKERFFFDPWVRMDKPYKGVVQLLQWISAKDNVKIVYLTGRDWENMAEGTMEAFREWHLPVEHRTSFIFKPTQDTEDLPFKKQAFEKIHKLGTVVLAVENEPVNANAMVKAFPSAKVALIDTVTAPNPAEPDESIIHFKNYSN